MSTKPGQLQRKHYSTVWPVRSAVPTHEAKEGISVRLCLGKADPAWDVLITESSTMDSAHHQLNRRFLIDVLDIRLNRGTVLDHRIRRLIHLPRGPHRWLRCAGLAYLHRIGHAGNCVLGNRRAQGQFAFLVTRRQLSKFTLPCRQASVVGRPCGINYGTVRAPRSAGPTWWVSALRRRACTFGWG